MLSITIVDQLQQCDKSEASHCGKKQNCPEATRVCVAVSKLLSNDLHAMNHLGGCAIGRTMLHIDCTHFLSHICCTSSFWRWQLHTAVLQGPICLGHSRGVQIFRGTWLRVLQAATVPEAMARRV